MFDASARPRRDTPSRHVRGRGETTRAASLALVAANGLLPTFMHWIGRGLATGDLDRDGRIDAVISHQADSSAVLHNETAGGASILLKLVGTRSNRNGLGTRVEVLTGENFRLTRELAGGSGFQSANTQEIHLGIGSHLRQNIIIHWISGKTDRYQDVPPGSWTAIEGTLELNRR